MRPNKLIIQAFGPFSETEQIDFDQLGNNPLFLINGPTGAGKSSILDAICFALYGQTTGKEREATQMRCDHAKGDLLTEITLEFTLGEQTYRIRRSPTQERPKSRGDGTTTHQTEAQLWEIKPDGEALLVPKKAQEATRIIEELTGLNVEQFRQVMVLPQGKFREFLMADSSQRESIFSKLFQTQIYKRLEDALKDRASTIRRDVEKLQNQIKGILQGADLHTEHEVEEQLAALLPQLEIATSQKQQASDALANAEKSLEAGTLLDKAFRAMAETQRSLQQLNAQQPAIDAKKTALSRAQTAQKISHLRETLAKVSQAGQQLEQEITASEQTLSQQQQHQALAEATLTKASTALQPIDEMKAEVAELRKLTPKIEQLAEATAHTRLTHKQCEVARTALSNSQTQLNTLIEQITKAETRGFEIKNALIPLPDKQVELENLLLLGKQRAKLDELLQQQQALTQQHASRLKTLEQATAAVTNQELEVKRKELAWHSNQAALLAAELKTGEPCPVCGSSDHPAPALPPSNQNPITKQAIEEARSQLAMLQQQQTQASNQLTQTDTQLQSTEKALIEQRHELGEHQYHSTDQLREDWRQLDAKVKHLQALQTEQRKLDADCSQLSEQCAKVEKQREAARVAQQQAEQDYSLAAQAERHIEQALPEQYRQPGALNHLINELDTQIKTLTEAHEQALASFNKASQNVTQIAAKLEQQSKQRHALIQECTEAQHRWRSGLEVSAFNDEADFLSAQLSELEQQQLQDELQHYTEQLSGCKATLQQQQKQLADQQPPDLEKLQADRGQLKTAAEQVFQTWKGIDNRHLQLMDVQRKLETAHQSNQALEAEYKIYGTLSDVASGQTGNKISLQRFVLSVLLDDVLIEASHRLHVMSKGRYLLVRKEDRAKGNKASGLELEVEDAYTGKTRSVATLSGGESFMAALSLALGLSDVVQAYAGGIKLDTLFIDEGFGSLDQESLDLAIKTLIDLQSSGRMIGIISHVSELREQMALRIDVQSSATGSTVAVGG